MSILDRITGRSSTEAFDREELSRLAQIVDQHFATYPATGAALREIRDRKLYRFEFPTFAEFIAARWKMTETHANRLIAAAVVAANLTPRGVTPPTEAHARPLAPLPAERQAEAWELAERLAGGDQPTASQVAAAAHQVAPRRKKTKARKRPKPIRLRTPTAIVIIEPGRGFSTVEQALQDALTVVSNRRQAA